MMLKIVSLFLVVIAVLALFGKLRVPRLSNPFRKPRIGAARRCERCGRFLIGSDTCTCPDKS